MLGLSVSFMRFESTAALRGAVASLSAIDLLGFAHRACSPRALVATPLISLARMACRLVTPRLGRTSPHYVAAGFVGARPLLLLAGRCRGYRSCRHRPGLAGDDVSIYRRDTLAAWLPLPLALVP